MVCVKRGKVSLSFLLERCLFRKRDCSRGFNVIACSSVEFLDSVILQNNSYGNSDVLLSAFRAVGKEPVPVGLNPKPFADKDISIDILTAEDATQYTVVLTVIPAVIALVTGIVIIIRRKNR